MKIYMINNKTQHGKLISIDNVADLPYSIDQTELTDIQEVIDSGNVYHLKINVYETILNYFITK